MGELIFTFCYGGALIVAGILVKVMTSKQVSEKVEREEEFSKNRQGSVI
ncbi:hypothetical protein [Siminovitchia acidinfaciens]|nr:hypothetical protein [Siminovitchia acidinfaciens]